MSFLQSSEDSFFAVPSWLLIVSVKWRASLLGYFNRFCYLLTNLPPTLFFKRNVMMWTYAFVETWCLNFTPVVELHKRPDFYIVFPVNQHYQTTVFKWPVAIQTFPFCFQLFCWRCCDLMYVAPTINSYSSLNCLASLQPSAAWHTLSQSEDHLKPLASWHC